MIPSRHGFTLIELLAAIVLLGMVVALSGQTWLRLQRASDANTTMVVDAQAAATWQHLVHRDGWYATSATIIDEGRGLELTTWQAVGDEPPGLRLVQWQLDTDGVLWRTRDGSDQARRVWWWAHPPDILFRMDNDRPLVLAVSAGAPGAEEHWLPLGWQVGP